MKKQMCCDGIVRLDRLPNWRVTFIGDLGPPRCLAGSVRPGDSFKIFPKDPAKAVLIPGGFQMAFTSKLLVNY